MRRSRAMELLRGLDPVPGEVVSDPAATPEARELLESIVGSDPQDSTAGSRRAWSPRLVAAAVVTLLLIPAGYGLWRSFGPLLSDDPVGPAPTASTPLPPPADRRYEASTFILQEEGEPAMLCLGGVLESLPPQCGDVPITNWEWGRVAGEESLAGVTWGEFHVVGTYDGASFTVVDAGPPRPRPDPGPGIEVPCPEPEGGWTAPDPGRTSDADLRAAGRLASGQPDSSGWWIKHLDEPVGEGPYGPGDIVMNAAFTGDLDRHRLELAELWGGPLCVVRYHRTEDELRRIQDEITDRGDEEFGLVVLYSSTDIVHNLVEVGVVVADEATRAAVDARYGPGVVRLFPALVPAGAG